MLLSVPASRLAMDARAVLPYLRQPMDDPKLIDHIPNERRPSNAGEWAAWIIVAASWVWYLYFRDFDWISIALGCLTGGMIVSWIMERTGNKAPDWIIRSLQSGDRNRRS